MLYFVSVTIVFMALIVFRLRVGSLSLSPSSKTVNKPRGKNGRVKWPFFSLAVLFRVTHERPSENGTTGSLENTLKMQTSLS